MFTQDFRKMIYGAIGFGILGSLLGLFMAYKLNVPSGATIIFSFVILFIIAKLFQLSILKLKRKAS